MSPGLDFGSPDLVQGFGGVCGGVSSATRSCLGGQLPLRALLWASLHPQTPGRRTVPMMCCGDASLPPQVGS